jgi:hypothetical protein
MLIRKEESTFWTLASLAADDDLNRIMWETSASLQAKIHPPETLTGINALGAQQAMLDPDPLAAPPITSQTVLPWVPDLLGANWTDEESLLIVGSAYAGFIREYNGGKGLRIRDYLACSQQKWSRFQAEFIRQVVTEFRAYYGFVERLVRALSGQGATISNAAITELCRASFVRRVGHDGSREWERLKGYVNSGVVVRHDKSGDPSGPLSAQVFARYVENPTAAEWLWQRMWKSKARRVVVLGRVAEHGLLRCLASRTEVSNIACSQGCWIRFHRPDDDTWARLSGHADPRVKLSHWLANRDWWTVTASVEGKARHWHVLPIRHPSRSAVDVQQVARILRLM